jgi:hypothetical protein
MMIIYLHLFHWYLLFSIVTIDEFYHNEDIGTVGNVINIAGYVTNMTNIQRTFPETSKSNCIYINVFIM